MSENCTHDCSNCSSSSNCKDKDMYKQPHELSKIKKVIGVVSGKGGVGKSLVTSLMSIAMKQKGLETAILDADITGPSIPKSFGITEKAMANEYGLFPVISKTGIKIMSINLILENETDPVVWRGPIISGTVQQFWTDVIWDNVDVMFIDMPPGTGDVPLTVFQSIKIDGIIIVASPQDLVSMIVSKAVNMANAMNIPILGIVENMSYFQCDECGKKHHIFGESHINNIAKQYNIEKVAKLPIDSKIAEYCDKGIIEDFDGESLNIIKEVFEEI